MKRSFKARLFLHVVLITVVVIWANRVIAQYFLTDQLQTRIHQEMGVALTTCADHFENHGAFVNCFKAIEKGSLFSNASDFYVLCDRAKSAAKSGVMPACQSLLANDDFWQSTAVSSHGDLVLSMVGWGGRIGMPFDLRIGCKDLRFGWRGIKLMR